MRKSLTALAVAATVGIAAVSTTSPAEARWRGGGVAAGVIGGIAAGALIAGAARPYGYGYYGYAPGPAYYPSYGYGPACYWQRQRVWNGWAWGIRRVWVCG